MPVRYGNKIYGLNRVDESDGNTAEAESLNETSRRQKAKRAFLTKLDSIRTFCILTAENPMGHQLPPQENRILQDSLLSDLKRYQYRYFPTNGKYVQPEHSVFVYNISLESAKNICKKYDQESFIFAMINSREHIVDFKYYQKNKSEKVVAPSKDKEYYFVEVKREWLDRIDFDDEFTCIGRNFKFKVPFDIFCGQVDSISEMVEERSVYPEYKRRFHELLNESVDDSLTFKARRIARAQLWGANFISFFNKV